MSREVIALTPVAVSGTTAYPGIAVLVEDYPRGGFQTIISAGTPSGTFKWQGSCDYDHGRPASATWTDLTSPSGFSSGQPVAGVPATWIFDFNVMPAVKAIRIVYTNSSGTGTLGAVASLKEA